MPARAKVNWTLDIVGQREDGYHLLDSLMQPIGLQDTLCIKQGTELSLQIGGPYAFPVDEKNLVLRAARALQERFGIDQGARIYLDKQIPLGAGLGGGSADCAAALRGLCCLWQIDIKEEELTEIGLSLGADVPFCLFDEPARVQGIGEKITPVPSALRCPLVLIRPCEALSTAAVFSALHTEETMSSDLHACLAALEQGKLRPLADHGINALEPAAQAIRPEIEGAKKALLAQGAVFARMTGSGAVVFGAFEDKKAAGRAYRALKRQYPICLLTHAAL